MTQTPTAVPNLRLGRRPASDKPTLKASRFLTGITPEHPVAVDHFGDVTYGLMKNDRYGVCGPVSLAHYIQLVTRALAGTERVPSWDDVVELYRRQNPLFDERDPGGAGDLGVEMKTLLADAVKHGYGASQVLGFAEVDARDPEEIQAAVAIFGGVLLGLDLDVVQSGQLADARWDYVPDSPTWGGHAVMEGAYREDESEECVTWGQRVAMSAQFLARQRIEAYVVILPEHLGDRRFVQGWDLEAFAAAYEQITGRVFPAPVPPTPEPTPQPVPDPVPAPTDPEPEPGPVPAPDPSPEDELAESVRDWVYHRRHRGPNKAAALALRSWFEATGRA